MRRLDARKMGYDTPSQGGRERERGRGPKRTNGRRQWRKKRRKQHAKRGEKEKATLSTFTDMTLH